MIHTLVCVVFADFACHSYQHNILEMFCIFFTNNFRFFIAFGWIQSTLEGDEQNDPHTVQVGYSKGGGTSVNVHVELVQDPQASFHASEFIGLHCELASTVIQHLQCHVFQIQVILEAVSLFLQFLLLLVPPPPM